MGKIHNVLKICYIVSPYAVIYMSNIVIYSYNKESNERQITNNTTDLLVAGHFDKL